MSNLDLLPRADLPVIWEDFKTKVDKVRRVAETLTVTSIDQKDDMALARRVRLTLREIRIAVEHKRVELGEGHLKEIQKVNGAAKAIREFIEPLEARLLIQEEFGERAEAARIDELALRRQSELYALRPHIIVKDVGSMSQENYDELLGILKTEQAEKEAANRLRVEAERRLVEQREEYRRQTVEAEIKAASERAQLLAEQAEFQRQLQVAREAEGVERRKQQAQRDAELAEQKRIQDEQLAVLEAELKAERAVKLAEEKRVMELAIAPDVEKLWEFAQSLRRIECPRLTTPCGISFSESLRDDLLTIAHDIEVTCKSWGLTTK